MKAESQSAAGQMIASLENGVAKDRLDAVALSGIASFGLSNTYSYEGADLRGATFFLIKGRSRYPVTAQASVRQ